ncbi:hypothetical protein V7O66_02865 [Methanolobus sp. ZRKC3]|uniref:hypothetical protein n=1 Tax=Methanolobus sp. ZRKC3 TaxID=3125786 RepID=UPI00324A0BA7
MEGPFMNIIPLVSMNPGNTIIPVLVELEGLTCINKIGKRIASCFLKAFKYYFGGMSAIYWNVPPEEILTEIYAPID